MEERHPCVYGPSPDLENGTRHSMRPCVYGPPTPIRRWKKIIIKILIILVSLLALFVTCYTFFMRTVYGPPPPLK